MSNNRDVFNFVGQSEECAKYQGQLHRNLVYLATIADSNNQTAQGKHPPGRSMFTVSLMISNVCFY